MRDPFLRALRQAISTELTLRSGLTPDRVRALLVPRFMGHGPVRYELISGCLDLPYDRIGRLVRPLSEHGEWRTGGGLLTIRTGIVRSDKFVELTEGGHALCDRLDRLDPDRADPSIESVLSVLSAFREAVPGGHLRDLVLLVNLGEAESARYDGRAFPVGSSHLRRLREAELVERSGAAYRGRYQPPALSEEGRSLLHRLAGLSPSAIKRWNDRHECMVTWDGDVAIFH